MITDHQLQLYFDGELSEQEHASIEQALLNDPDLAEKLAQLTEQSELHLASFPESKGQAFIEDEIVAVFRQIDEEDESVQTGEDQKIVSFPSWLRSSNTWMSVAAALLLSLSGIWAWMQFTPTPGATSEIRKNTTDSQVAFVDTDIAGASSTIFQDEDSGWTIVWVDEPESLG